MKDAFFSLPLAEKPTNFASEWTDPEAEFLGQLTQIQLPQGFKSFPSLAYKALNSNLQLYRANTKR